MITRIEATRYHCFDELDVELGDCSQIATAGCVDPAFRRVRDAIRTWFPVEGA